MPPRVTHLDCARFCPCTSDCPEHIRTAQQKLYPPLDMVKYREQQVARDPLYPIFVYRDWHRGLLPHDSNLAPRYDPARILIRYSLPGGDEKLSVQHHYHPVIY